MQTRRQAQAAALAAAAQGVATIQPVVNVQPPPPAANATHTNPLQRSDSWGSLSSLSTLTPSSSFVSDAGSDKTEPAGGNLSAIAEGEEDGDADDDTDTDDIPNVYGTAHGVPEFVRRARAGASLRTPVHSQTNFFPAAVFETPQKNVRQLPSEKERRAAKWQRDLELATSGGMAQLTRTGTLVYADSFAGPADYRGHNLEPAFRTPSSGLTRTKTRLIDPKTGEFVRDDD